MANHLQAKKRNRQAIKRTVRNRHFRTSMRTHIKRVRTLVDSGEAGEAKEALGTAIKQIDKAVTKGIVHRRTASRTISRLTIAVNKLA
ncbi:MAG: 30S ribosomal protein S20 [Deltaproteobacteria bacterium]|nr:30S ribosomal protein S20 [Deltaproteobacteria bacterium]